MINLGDEVVDTITGFVGVAVSRTTYLQGCDRIGIQPPIGKDGKLPDYESFDEPQLRIKESKKVPEGDRKVGGVDKWMDKER